LALCACLLLAGSTPDVCREANFAIFDFLL